MMKLGEFARATGLTRGQVRRLAGEGFLLIVKDSRECELLDPENELNAACLAKTPLERKAAYDIA